MEMYATTVYVLADEILRFLNIQDDPQSYMSQAEVITFAIISAKNAVPDLILQITNVISCLHKE